MKVIASFNYYGPPVAGCVGAGILFLIVCVLIALKVRSALAGCGIGAVTGGLIAGAVFSAGSGGMTGLIVQTMGGIGAVLGAVLGGVCEAIGKSRKRGGDNEGDGGKGM